MTINSFYFPLDSMPFGLAAPIIISFYHNMIIMRRGAHDAQCAPLHCFLITHCLSPGNCEFFNDKRGRTLNGSRLIKDDKRDLRLCEKQTKKDLNGKQVITDCFSGTNRLEVRRPPISPAASFRLKISLQVQHSLIAVL
jgi:hypothetical protein